MKFRTILNNNIRYLINSQSIKVVGLAEELNVNRSTLTNYYYDKAVPSLDFLLKFAEKFHISLDDLTKKDLTDPNYVADEDAVYHRTTKEDKLHTKEVELLKKEVELLQRENNILEKQKNEFQNFLKNTRETNAKLSAQLTILQNKIKSKGLLEGKKQN